MNVYTLYHCDRCGSVFRSRTVPDGLYCIEDDCEHFVEIGEEYTIRTRTRTKAGEYVAQFATYQKDLRYPYSVAVPYGRMNDDCTDKLAWRVAEHMTENPDQWKSWNSTRSNG